MSRLLLISILLLAACNSQYKTLRYSASKQQLPFVQEYTNEQKAVLVFGSYHTNDTTDKELTEIEQQFTKFKPELVLYEGDNIGLEKRKNDNIINYYEMGLVRWLAKQQNIPDLNLEPSSAYLTEELQKKYTTDEILLATILGQNMLYIKQNSKEDLERLYPILISDLQAAGLQLKEEQKSITHFYRLYSDFYGYEFNPETFDYTTVEIAYDKTKLNEIVRYSASLRDQFMLRRIDSCLHHHDKIYVQIGGRHAIVWQPALKKIMGKH